jgi:hypothetical protein
MPSIVCRSQHFNVRELSKVWIPTCWSRRFAAAEVRLGLGFARS